jgi:DnaJ-class molecular chaperone
MNTTNYPLQQPLIDAQTGDAHISASASCPSCGGSGAKGCSSCGGTGKMNPGDPYSLSCSYCGGDGNTNCGTCGGSGYVN